MNGSLVVERFIFVFPVAESGRFKKQKENDSVIPGQRAIVNFDSREEEFKGQEPGTDSGSHESQGGTLGTTNTRLSKHLGWYTTETGPDANLFRLALFLRAADIHNVEAALCAHPSDDVRKLAVGCDDYTGRVGQRDLLSNQTA